MKKYNVAQGSYEWLKLRAGKPTASQFDKIITPTGNISASQDGYLRNLLAERIMGRPLEEIKTEWMERGTELEPKAAQYYELERGVDLEVVGFCTDDSGQIGCSPDRLVGSDGLLEIKCPSPQVHIGYALFDDHRKKYYPQLQGQLLVTGRDWVDIVSYHPEMPTAIVRVERDEKFIASLTEELTSFVERLETETIKAQERGWIRESATQDTSDFLTDEDLDAILAARK